MKKLTVNLFIAILGVVSLHAEHFCDDAKNVSRMKFPKIYVRLVNPLLKMLSNRLILLKTLSITSETDSVLTFQITLA